MNLAVFACRIDCNTHDLGTTQARRKEVSYKRTVYPVQTRQFLSWKAGENPQSLFASRLCATLYLF